jgi:hypothetical protein
MYPVHTCSLTAFAALGAATALTSGCGKADHAPGSAVSGSAGLPTTLGVPVADMAQVFGK